MVNFKSLNLLDFESKMRTITLKSPIMLEKNKGIKISVILKADVSILENEIDKTLNILFKNGIVFGEIIFWILLDQML